MQTELTLNKAVAALVGVAMAAGLAFTFAAERAHAVTFSELIELFIALDIIPSDKAEEARAVLANQGGETPSTPAAGASCSYNFTMNLKAGSTGAEVMNLQKFLNSDPATVVAATGAGSKGAETSYYGPATAAAVSKFQEKYAAEILTPLGLTKGTGFFGASTRAKANAVCAAGGPATPPPPPATPGDDDDATDDDDDTLSGGEASLTGFKRSSSPSSVEVAENKEEVQVAGFEFDVDDADARINRVDVRFKVETGASSYSKRPSDYFTSVQLLLDGEVIAEKDADSRSDWNDRGSDVYEMRFTGLSEIVKEDEKAKLVVAVSTKQLDTKNEDSKFQVWIPANGVRARDGAGIDQYTGGPETITSTDYRTFETTSASQNDELRVTLASGNPEASVIKVDRLTKVTKDVAVLVFDVKAKGNDMEISSLPVFFTIDDAFSDMIAAVKLDVDGTVFDDYTLDNVADTAAGVSTTTVTFDFEDGDFVIDEDDTVTVKVLVDFNKLNSNYDEGDTIKAELRSTEVEAIDAEGGDTLSSTELKGTALGEEHQVLSRGIFAEVVSIDEVKTAGDNNANDIGEYKIKFEVTAFDNTFYIDATSTSAFVARIEDGAGADEVTATSGMMALTTSATKQGNNYLINDGKTETFTLTIKYNPTTSGFSRAELDSIWYGDESTTPYESKHNAKPDKNFESDNLYLNG